MTTSIGELLEFLQSTVWKDMLSIMEERLKKLGGSLEVCDAPMDIYRLQGAIDNVRWSIGLPIGMLQTLKELENASEAGSEQEAGTEGGDSTGESESYYR